MRRVIAYCRGGRTSIILYDYYTRAIICKPTQHISSGPSGFILANCKKKCCRVLSLCSFALLTLPPFPSSNTTKCRRRQAESPQCSLMVAMVFCRFAAGSIGGVLGASFLGCCAEGSATEVPPPVESEPPRYA